MAPHRALRAVRPLSNAASALAFGALGCLAHVGGTAQTVAVALIALRQLVAIALGMMQLATAAQLRQGRAPQSSASRAPYTVMSALTGWCWLEGVAEVVVAGVLAAGTAGQSDVQLQQVVGIGMLWGSLLVRLCGSALPFRWVGLLTAPGDEQLTKERWRKHHGGRLAGALRWAMCCLGGRPAYLCGSEAAKPVLPGVCDQDQLSAVGSSLAVLLDYRAEGLSHRQALGLLAELFDRRRAASSADREDLTSTHLSAWQSTALAKALELEKYAIAVYTGFLLDMQRYSPFCALCCWLGGAYPAAMAPRTNDEQPVAGDTCGRAASGRFKAYLGEDEVKVLQGQVGQGACRVAYMLASRNNAATGERELVLAVRGTEDLFDMITDGLMQPAPLCAADLGLPREDGDRDGEHRGDGDHGEHRGEHGEHGEHGSRPPGPDYGTAHLGALLCARDLVRAVRGPLLALLQVSQLPRPCVWIVGHSLGASVASMVALALQPSVGRRTTVTALACQPIPALDPIALGHSLRAYPHAVLSLPFGDDIVSRLSLGRLRRVSERVSCLRGSPGGAVAWTTARGCRFACLHFWRCLVKGGDQIAATESRGRARRAVYRAVSGEASPDEVERSDDHLALEDGQLSAPIALEAGDLHLAGQVVHVQRAESSFIAVPRPITDRGEALRDIVLSDNMLVDHVPWRLQGALAQLQGALFEPRSGGRWRGVWQRAARRARQDSAV